MTQADLAKVGAEMTDGAGRMVRRTGDVGSAALMAAAEADVKARFTLAQMRPRSEDDAGVRILNACRRPAFAAPPGPGKQVAMFSVPVGGSKPAEGLSIHAAREFRRLWGNIDTAITLVFEDDDKEVWRVSTTDLETNFRRSIDVQVTKSVQRRSPKKGDEVLRSRTNSYGDPVYIVRAEGDELKATRGKAIAIAERETILAMLPGDLKEEAIAEVKKTQQNEDARDPAAARKAVCDSFAELGILPRAIEEQYLGHPLEQTTPAEYTELRGLYAALRSGEVESWTAACAAKRGDDTGDEKLDKAAQETREKLAAKRAEIERKAKAGKPAPRPTPTTEQLDQQRAAAIDRGADPENDGR